MILAHRVLRFATKEVFIIHDCDSEMPWIIKINAITNFAAFLIGILFYRNFPKEIKLVFYFVTLGAITEISARLFMHYVIKNAMPIGHIYFPLSVLIVGLFYLQILKGFIKPVYVLSLVILFEIYTIVNTVFIQSILEYPSLVGSIGSLLIFMMAVAFFIKVMIEAKITNLYKEPLIWINTGFLIYYTGNFFYHILYNIGIMTTREVALLAGKFFSVNNLLFYLIIGIAFLMFHYQPKKKQVV